MNPKLRAMLVSGGIAMVGLLAFPLLLAREGIRDADLIDAGIEACPDVVLSCALKSTQDGVCIDSDGNPRDAGSYCQLEVNGKDCKALSDGGLIPFPDVFDGGAIFLGSQQNTQCVTSANGKLPNGQKKKLAQHFCACVPNPFGTCTTTKGPGNTLYPGEWSGGCQVKPCDSVPVYVDGGNGRLVMVDDSWPSNCPQ